MTNQQIAQLLKNVAAAYTIQNANRFKILAYDKAADSIEHLTHEVKDIWNQGKLNQIPGIGPSIASHLDELFRTGQVKHFDSVMGKIPKSIYPLLELTGFGPKKAAKLVTTLKLEKSSSIIDDLTKAANLGKIAQIEGFGEKSQEDILESINAYKKGRSKQKRMPLPYAYALAEEVVSYLRRSKDVLKVTPLGSLRRMVSTIGDIDLAVSTNNPQKVVDYFLSYPQKGEIVEKGPEGATILLVNGQQIDMRVIKPKAWGSMLQYFTGSKYHNIKLREFALKKGLSLNEYGIKDIKTKKMKEFDSEERFYRYLGLDWMPPELREDRGEVEAARNHRLPNLVEIQDIKGDLQIHSDYPIEPSHDLGQNSMEEILAKAKELNYQYVAFTEHNPSVSMHTKNQIINIMKRRKAMIEQIRESTKSVRILNLLEIDILASGKLSLPDEAFEFIDAALVSIHSSFNQNKIDMTKRVLNGLSHSKAKIFAHPTGRLINQREGINLDFNQIFSFCAKHNKALEINSYPNRLDLPDNLVKEALGFGIKFTLGTDSHEIKGMDLMPYGVAVARRGWLEADDIWNTKSYNEVLRWLKEK